MAFSLNHHDSHKLGTKVISILPGHLVANSDRIRPQIGPAVTSDSYGHLNVTVTARVTEKQASHLESRAGT